MTDLCLMLETFPFENLDATQAIGFEAELNYTFNNKLNVDAKYVKIQLPLQE